MRKIVLVVVCLISLFAKGLHAQSITSVSPSSGPTEGGTVVIITGDFPRNCGVVPICPDIVVTFGGVRATTTRGPLTLTSIRATTPPHAPGQVDVTYTLGGLREPVVLRNGFTYVSAAEPVPTTSQWGLVALGLVLLFVGWRQLH